MTKEDNAFLGDESVDEDDDGVGVGAGSGEVGMEGKGLGGRGVWGGKALDELDEGEVAHGFGREGGRDFDGNRDLVVCYFGFESVGISRSSITCGWAVTR